MTSNDPNLGQVYLTVTSTVHQASDFNSKPFETAFDLDDQRFDRQELLGKISDVHCSTQPTNFNISRTIETPIQANDENFDFSPRDGLGHYFDQGEPMAVNLLIAQLPSKKFTSSVSGSLASGINPDSKFSPSIEKEELLKNKAKSANLSMLKLTIQSLQYQLAMLKGGEKAQQVLAKLSLLLKARVLVQQPLRSGLHPKTTELVKSQKRPSARAHSSSVMMG